MTQHRILLLCSLFLLAIAYPHAAHAYLPVVVGLVGVLGATAGVAISVVLGITFIAFFHGKQIKRWLTGESKEDDGDDEEETPNINDTPDKQK